MIARIWSGKTAEKDAEAYHRYLLETGIKEYKETKGNLGVIVLRAIKENKAEFRIVSFWESYDAIKNFAGDDPEKAVFYPADEDFLVEKDLVVNHYDVLEFKRESL